MNETVPHNLMCLNTRFLGGGVVLTVIGTSRRQSLSGGRVSLVVGDVERVQIFSSFTILLPEYVYNIISHFLSLALLAMHSSP